MSKAIQIVMPASGTRRNYAPKKMLHVHGIIQGTTIDKVMIQVNARDNAGHTVELNLAAKPLQGCHFTAYARHNLNTEPDKGGTVYITAVLIDKASGNQIGSDSVLISHKYPRGSRQGVTQGGYGAWTVIDIPYDGENNVTTSFTACGYDDTGDSGITTTPNVSGTITDGSTTISGQGSAATCVEGYDWSIPFMVPAALQNKWVTLTVTQNSASDHVEIWVPS
jgi:hypothetical protein